jgi:hypothetical protein
MSGKGSRQRPTKDQKKFDENWDRIFTKRRPSDFGVLHGTKKKVDAVIAP